MGLARDDLRPSEIQVISSAMRRYLREAEEREVAERVSEEVLDERHDLIEKEYCRTLITVAEETRLRGIESRLEEEDRVRDESDDSPTARLESSLDRLESLVAALALGNGR